MKVTLKNFQSITEGTFEFGPGITLITGPTNSGKTAVFRALTSLLTNPAEASTFINYNSSELSVKMELEDESIEFHRDQGKAWYMINGQKYSKLSRNNIFDIYPAMSKLLVYRSEDQRKVLNFQTEDQTAFPFDRSDTEMFKLFERIFNIADTRAIMDTIKKEEDETAFKLGQYSADKTAFTQDITNMSEALKDLDLANLEILKSQVSSLSDQVSKMIKIFEAIQSYVPVLTHVSELPEIESLGGDVLVQEIVLLNSKIISCYKYQEYLKNYTEMNLSPLNLSLESECLHLNEIIASVSRYQGLLVKQNSVVSALETELQSVTTKLLEYKNCPLCGNSIKEK